VVGGDHQGAAAGQIDLDPLAIVGMQPELPHILRSNNAGGDGLFMALSSPAVDAEAAARQTQS
jgi:hypothetical protein